MIKLFPTIKKILRWLAGQDAIHTNSNLGVTGETGTNTGYRASKTNKSGDVSVMVGTGGDNHGLYSHTKGTWMMYSDGTDIISNETLKKRMLSGSKSVPTGTSTFTNLTSINLPAGQYLINYHVYWPSNATGFRYITYGTSATGDGSAWINTDSRAAVSGKVTINRVVRVENGGWTIYFNAQQNSGSALTATYRIEIVRLGQYNGNF